MIVPKNDKLFVPQKGQVVCPSKRASCLSLKKGKLFVPQKDKLFVPQKGQNVCPSKRAKRLSLKKDGLIVPQKEQVVENMFKTSLSFQR